MINKTQVVKQVDSSGAKPTKGESFKSSALLLAGGFLGATVFTLLQIPAGALVGSVGGAMVVNALVARRLSKQKKQRGTSATHIRALPRPLRITGQVLLGVIAGSQLTVYTLEQLFGVLIPMLGYVVALLASTILLARYLFIKFGIDPVTAVISAMPGGLSEILPFAQRQGAQLHAVLTIHMFRVLVVVLIVLPIMILNLDIR
ncbi:AbrB family transcriptional regulator [Glutamicibacter arilaitensis]|uniref:AbrB family transcriptional regulator n=1 Tax=Glutamicibacter arilaitensis TaxID=256701 RepID=UPI0038509F5E